MESQVDESLYSRQLYVLGSEAMQKLGQAKILVAGMRGLGVEVAKNIILGGAKAVTVQDTGLAEWRDLSSQYYLKEADLGKNRAEASLKSLSELNGYVKVEVCTEPLNEEIILNHKAVILTDSDYKEQIAVSEICRRNEIYFLIADTKGLFGQIFCDFGEKFIVHEQSGENPAEYQIETITKDKEGVVTCAENIRSGLDSGDFVTFTNIKGMTELNDGKPREIKVLSPHSFSIGDTTNMSDYINGGLVTEFRYPIHLAFKSMKDSLLNPEFVSDIAKLHRAPLLHFAFRVLHEYKTKQNRLPRPRSQEDIGEFLSIAREMMSNSADVSKPDSVDEDLLRKFVSCAAGDLAPMQSIIGGIAAQEVMKACSGKFNPIFQWFYFDAVECLDGLVNDEETEKSCAPKDCRYDGQIAVFGEEFQKHLATLKYFLVGAGALGCEYLKNWALMGLGEVTVTDMDHIEKSNLNRQFLFRPQDIGKSKAVVAGAAARGINPSLVVHAHNNRVGTETEDIYDESFYESLSGVANALDNVEARRYVDGRCVYFGKHLLECGTNGVKASQQVIIPYMTQCYSDMKDSPQKTFPICTLKNFPSVIEHTLQWARDQFEGIFNLQVSAGKEFLEDEEFIQKTRKLSPASAVDKFQSVVDLLGHSPPRTFHDCVLWARQLFQENYFNQISQLLHNFPPDYKTPQGAPFWSGTKRCPHPIEFDEKNETHQQYVRAAANLYSFMFGLGLEERDEAGVARQAASCHIPAFVPQEGVKIAANDEEETKMRQENTQSDEDLEKLIKLLPSRESLTGIKLNPIDFEKDDDNNYHMDFIFAASNLRAENYEIPPADRMKSKRIAGRIIPAIATTTTMIVGLICLEFYKLHRDLKKLNLFKNGFVNLAGPMFAFTEPLRPKMNKYNQVEFSVWDRFEIDGDITLQELLDTMKEKHGLTLNFLGYGIGALYGFESSDAARAELLNKKVLSLVESKAKVTIPAHVKSIQLIPGADDVNGEYLENLPYIKYNLRHRE